MPTENNSRGRRALGALSVEKTQQWLSREHNYRKVRELFDGGFEIWAGPGSDDVLWPPRSVFFAFCGKYGAVVSAHDDSLVWEAPNLVCLLCSIRDERDREMYSPSPCGNNWCQCSCGRTTDQYCGTGGA